MRIGEILKEDTSQDLRDTLIDILLPLYAKDVNSITLNQLLDILKLHIEYRQLQLDPLYMMDVLRTIGFIDSITDQVITFRRINSPEAIEDEEVSVESKNTVEKMAMNTMKRNRE